MSLTQISRIYISLIVPRKRMGRHICRIAHVLPRLFYKFNINPYNIKRRHDLKGELILHETYSVDRLSASVNISR